MTGTPSHSSEASTSGREIDRDKRRSSTQEFQVTDHAKLRWVQRARDFERSLTSAWEAGSVSELARPCGFSEIRFDDRSETLLCARDGKIVTVLHARHEPLKVISRPDRWQCAGCSRRRTSRDSHCQHCGTRPVVEEQHSDRFFIGGNN